MKSIRSFLDFTLTLQQSSIWKASYEIRFGDELLGSINMPKLWSDRAEAASIDGNWSFERQGIFKSKIVAKAHDGTQAASYQPHPFKRRGSLIIGEEEPLSIKIGVFRNTLDVYSHFDEQIMHVKNHGVLRLRSEITLSYAAKRMPQIPLIFFMSCYILLCSRRDAERSAGHLRVPF
jgi:hypothetical protein